MHDNVIRAIDSPLRERTQRGVGEGVGERRDGGEEGIGRAGGRDDQVASGGSRGDDG